MSLAPAYPAAARLSTTERRLYLALAIVGLAVLTGCVIYILERYLFQPRRRFMESPAEVMMRALGVGHFLVGWLFLFTSPRLRRVSALASLLFWTVVGAAACWAFAALGGTGAPLVLFAFYALFLAPTLAVFGVLGFEALDSVLAARAPTAVRSLLFGWAAAFLGAIALSYGA